MSGLILLTKQTFRSIEVEVSQEDIINLVFVNEKEERWAFIPGDEDQQIHNIIRSMGDIDLEQRAGKEPNGLKGEYVIEIYLPQDHLTLTLQNGELTMEDTVYKVSGGDLAALIEGLELFWDQL